MVISFDELKPAIRVLSIIRHAHPTLPVLVRCKDQVELEELRKFSATKIIAETFEESLALSYYLLRAIRIPTDTIFHLMEKVRGDGYNMLQLTFH